MQGTHSTFAIAGVSYSADSIVVNGNSVLRIKFSGEKPRHRKSAKRWGQVLKKDKAVKIKDDHLM